MTMNDVMYVFKYMYIVHVHPLLIQYYNVHEHSFMDTNKAIREEVYCACTQLLSVLTHMHMLEYMP